MKKINPVNDINITINMKSVIAFFAIVAACWFFYTIQSVLVLIFIGLILALALEPSVEWVKNKGVPHGLSVIIVFFGVLGIFIGLASIAFSPLINQISLLSANFPFYMQSLLDIPGVDKYSDAVMSQLTSGGQQIFSYTLGAFSGAVSALVVIVFTIYLLLDFNNMRRRFVNLFPGSERRSVQVRLSDLESKLKDWLRGQVILMVIIGTISYVGLILMGLSDYALALAVIAGLLEAIPVIGPTVALIPAAIIGFTISTPTGIGVIGLYILIQQLENHFIVPKVMERAIGFNPLVTIVAFMVGGQLFGVIGAVLSLPAIIILAEVITYVKVIYHKENKAV